MHRRLGPCLCYTGDSRLWSVMITMTSVVIGLTSVSNSSSGTSRWTEPVSHNRFTTRYTDLDSDSLIGQNPGTHSMIGSWHAHYMSRYRDQGPRPVTRLTAGRGWTVSANRSFTHSVKLLSWPWLKRHCDRSENGLAFAISSLHKDLRPSPERGGPNLNWFLSLLYRMKWELGGGMEKGCQWENIRANTGGVARGGVIWWNHSLSQEPTIECWQKV
jgi:hypothetical protein